MGERDFITKLMGGADESPRGKNVSLLTKGGVPQVELCPYQIPYVKALIPLHLKKCDLVW